MQKPIETLILAAIFIVGATQSAHAYIDPGSGSAILAAIIGFFVAIGISIKTYWYKILGVFGKNKSSSDQGE